MMLSELKTTAHRLSTAPPIWHSPVDAATWQAVAHAAPAHGGRLVALWGSDRRPIDGYLAVHAAFADAEGLHWLTLPLDNDAPNYPDISEQFPVARRMQRAVHDLLGFNATGATDTRPWLRHSHWPADWFPLRHESNGQAIFVLQPNVEYPFVEVSGDGVHEIAVGPVHAGIIEPGHFRFSIVGERVLRLEERLGYTHKGISKRFETMSPLDAHRLAGRVSGDTSVAFSWAYCMALEMASQCPPPERALWLRAVLLERERVANHLGDLGALGNDAAFGLGLAQFSRLREDWLRLSGAVFGHRLLMDQIVPGGVACDPDRTALERLRKQCDTVENELHVLQRIYDEHAGIQDRFLTTGRVTPQLAAQLGLTGLAGRASQQAYDLRVDYFPPPYDQLRPQKRGRRRGDVAARVAVRFDEIFESLRLIRELCRELPAGPISTAINLPKDSAHGLGWIESWRGPILVALELAACGQIRSCHCHDPSWHNWPLLEHAVIDNIVPDFPLINKSFNLSYSGHDL